jgi:8-oxo-dGTP pyrophosphatase MutT (NUDIX family)
MDLMDNVLTLSENLRARIRDNLSRFAVRQIGADDRKHAAVALAILDRRCDAGIGEIPFDPSQAGQAAFILTVRAARLRRHAGQRAFPGGRIDPGESPEQAALRELDEEVGLVLPPGNILGRLDDYATRSGFVISPVVVWAGPTGSLTPCPEEVESIHRIPFSELLRDDAPILEPSQHHVHPVLKMPLGNDWFAAPTAAIAYQFREVALRGMHTRVSHFDQPRFAWR